MQPLLYGEVGQATLGVQNLLEATAIHILIHQRNGVLTVVKQGHKVRVICASSSYFREPVVIGILNLLTATWVRESGSTPKYTSAAAPLASFEPSFPRISAISALVKRFGGVARLLAAE